MNDPFANLLPQTMHFAHLQGTQIVFLFGLIMFFGAVGGRLFQKLHIPQVVGYIVIGIIIGSSGFRVLEPETIVSLNPVSTIALSLIGILVGAELKIDVIKKYGKQFISILLFEAIVPFFIVGIAVTLVTYLITHDLTRAVSLGLILGAICSATAPAATTDVLVEYRTKGPLTTTTYGIVAMDDAVALILYATASTIVAPLLGGTVSSFSAQFIAILRDIFGSIILGSLFGLLLSFVIRNLMNEEGRILSFGLGALFLCTGICNMLNLDHILAAMSIGFFLVNFAPVKTRATFSLISKFTPPIYVLFFVLVGAKLNIWIITPFLGLLAIIYVTGRTLGKAIGSWFGAKITNAPKTVQKYLKFCLLSQAGVAIGLSIAAGNDFADSIGPQILLIITATTFIVQLVGPICVKYGVTKAGEVGLNVTEDDIKKNSCVKDVRWGNEYVCTECSPAIVNETETLESIIDSFSKQHNLNYVVRGENGKLTGLISLEHLKEVLQIGDFAYTMLAMDIMDKPTISCTKEMTLPDAYKMFDQYDIDVIPIVSADNQPLGVLERFAVDHYLHTRILELNSKVKSLG
ncbi:MAG: cation:proton antiporter [Treponema sp.]|nr:cation:proton antiporter [Treponema sp.]